MLMFPCVFVKENNIYMYMQFWGNYYTSPLSTFHLFPSSGMDYENEVDLLQAVITLPEEQDVNKATLFFIDEPTERVVKEVPHPTWQPGSLC